MNTQTHFSQLTVEAILKTWPLAFSVFRSRNTDCIGCLLQRFCTLQDVAETYSLSLQELAGDLETCVNENYPSKGVSNENLS